VFASYFSGDSGVFLLVFLSVPRVIHKLFLPRVVFAALSNSVVFGFPELMVGMYRTEGFRAISFARNLVLARIAVEARFGVSRLHDFRFAGTARRRSGDEPLYPQLHRRRS